jgi:FtsH-binding integral membrane protein
MLLLTTICTALLYDTTGQLAKNTAVIVLAIVGSFGIIIALTCCKLSTAVPANYILLSVFCLCQSVMLAIICSYYETKSVFIALVITAMIVSALTIYAWNTKSDFTILNGIMLVVLTALIVSGFIMMFFRTPFLETLYSFIGAVVFGVYIVIDVQMIEGKMREKYEIDDYVGGAMNLYLDILNLFIYVLQLLGKKND